MLRLKCHLNLWHLRPSVNPRSSSWTKLPYYALSNKRSIFWPPLKKRRKFSMEIHGSQYLTCIAMLPSKCLFKLIKVLMALDLYVCSFVLFSVCCAAQYRRLRKMMIDLFQPDEFAADFLAVKPVKPTKAHLHGYSVLRNRRA